MIFQENFLKIGVHEIIALKIAYNPHPVSSGNNRLYYDFSTGLTQIEKQSILIN